MADRNGSLVVIFECLFNIRPVLLIVLIILTQGEEDGECSPCTGKLTDHPTVVRILSILTTVDHPISSAITDNRQQHILKSCYALQCIFLIIKKVLCDPKGRDSGRFVNR